MKKLSSAHLKKGWRIERLGHPGCDKALFGFRTGSIFCFIDLSAQRSSIEEGEKVSLADQPNSGVRVKLVEPVDHPDTFSTGVVQDLVAS